MALGRTDNQDTPVELVQRSLTPEAPVRLSVQETRDDGKTHAHMHLGMEIGVLLSGRVEENQGRGWFLLEPGQAWACNPLELHRWRVLRPAVEVRFDFLPSLFVSLPSLEGFDPSAVFRSPVHCRAIGSNRTMRRSLLALGKEIARKHPRGTSPGQAYVALLRLLELVGNEVQGVRESPGPWCDLAAASRIQAALEMVERWPERRVSVAEVARACRMGRSSFFRLFRRVTGLSYAQYALRRRLALAAVALKACPEPLKVIARRFGFEDASHFHHAFVAHYGVTPGRFASPK